MSIFKKHKSHADRSASDRRRHKDKIEKAIKEGIHNIVAEESIIGQDGKKKIKIPVRGIKEYRFIYGDNGRNNVGSAKGRDIKRKQVVGQKNGQKATGNKADKERGEEFYEVEITLEELSNYLFDDLELPDLEKKQMKKLMSEKPKRHGYRNDGIRPRLDKKQTVKRMLKRKNIHKRINKDLEEEEDSFSFNEKDLRYKHVKNKPKEHSNAAIFFIMDVSGSMTQDKKYLARSFFFLLYHFVRSKYENTELIFVAHDVDAYEVDEDQFFSRGSGGGTIASSGLNLVNNIITKRYSPNSWNIYVFHCSDGDNWPSDNEKVLELAKTLETKCQLLGYCEIEPDTERIKWQSEDSKLASVFRFLEDSKIKSTKIINKSEIWSAFKAFFGGKLPNV